MYSSVVSSCLACSKTPWDQTLCVHTYSRRVQTCHTRVSWGMVSEVGATFRLIIDLNRWSRMREATRPGHILLTTSKDPSFPLTWFLISSKPYLAVFFETWSHEAQAVLEFTVW